MDSYMTIIFGILGIVTGITIPVMSDRIIAYKNHKRNIETDRPVLGGKSRGFIAVLNGLLWAYAGFGSEDILTAILVSILFTAAILISVIDIQIRLIPNELVLLMLCLGVSFQIIYFGWSALLSALICMVAIGSVFTIAGRFLGFEQIGAGDVKLAAAIGMVLGYPLIKIALIGMSAALLLYCLGGIAIKKLTPYSTFPFAPFIMFGTICALVDIGNI
ncbi:MAG: A24 family peptidase [Bacillota bacterium]